MIPLAALFVGAGLAVAVYGIAEHRRAKQDATARLIDAELADPSRSPEALADLVEKAGQLAERTFGGTGLAEKIRLTLTRAGWSLRPGEFTGFLVIGTIGAAAVAWLLTGSVMLAAGFAGLAPSATVTWLTRKGHKRVRKVEEQLPTMLQVMAGALDSGSSILSAMEMAASEGDPPLSLEFGRVVSETRVGRPLIEALEAMSSRVGSRDLAWTVEAIRIQHQTGGKLADTLRVLADFMRARLEIRGEVRALSAEAKLSAKVLTGLPLLLAGYFFFFRHSYFEPLYQTSMGKTMLVVAAGGLVIGSLWMRKLAQVEV